MREFFLAVSPEEKRLYARLHALEHLNGLPEGFAEKIPVFLRENSRLLTDLTKEHDKLPTELTFLVVPRGNLILTHTGDFIQATYAQLTCTKNAIAQLFGLYSPYDRKLLGSGYNIFSTPFPFPQALFDYIHTSSETSFDFFFHEPNPLEYIAADVQGFLHLSEDEDLSPRIRMPLPSKRRFSLLRSRK